MRVLLFRCVIGRMLSACCGFNDLSEYLSTGMHSIGVRRTGDPRTRPGRTRLNTGRAGPGGQKMGRYRPLMRTQTRDRPKLTLSVWSTSEIPLLGLRTKSSEAKTICRHCLHDFDHRNYQNSKLCGLILTPWYLTSLFHGGVTVTAPSMNSWIRLSVTANIEIYWWIA